jgi:AAA+ ATPase superfamily predicted ATPase
VNRARELSALDRLAGARGPQFAMVLGRRRVGKTTLLTTWAERSGLPTLYWVAKRDAPVTLMASLAQRLYAWQTGQDRAAFPVRPTDWDQVLGLLADAVGSRRCVVILDELPYLVESDPAFPSYLQAAWDHRLRRSQVRLFVSGSHVGMMTRLALREAPLYGRFTSQLPVHALDFPDLARFLPGYDVHRRLAVFAVLGGIPAYLERWDAGASIASNIERLFLRRTGWFRAEPMVLVSDLTRRETDTYEAILRAIAGGLHVREEIAQAIGTPSTALGHYLARLIDLGLVARRIPATVPPARQKASKDVRYFLLDPYLRFYHRFVDPNLHMIEQGLARRLWKSLEEQFRAFVADTFEDMARLWTLSRAAAGALPLDPEVVGGHWGKDAQVDVVAIDWRARRVLLGEAKWGAGLVGRDVVRDLVEKAPRVVPDGGRGWTVHHAFFAREGYTDAARIEGASVGATMLTLREMEPALRRPA